MKQLVRRIWVLAVVALVAWSAVAPLRGGEPPMVAPPEEGGGASWKQQGDSGPGVRPEEAEGCVVPARTAATDAEPPAVVRPGDGSPPLAKAWRPGATGPPAA